MKTVTPEQSAQIQMHLMSALNLLSQSQIIIHVSLPEALRIIDEAEDQLWRALQMFLALPAGEDSIGCVFGGAQNTPFPQSGGAQEKSPTSP